MKEKKKEMKMNTFLNFLVSAFRICKQTFGHTKAPFWMYQEKSRALTVTQKCYSLEQAKTADRHRRGKSVKCTCGASIQNTAAGSNFRPTGLVTVS